MKRANKRCRPEDGGSPADAELDFNSKTREFFNLCERTSLELHDTRVRLKAATELVEQKNKELEAQKAEHDAAIEAENDTVLQLTEERDELARSRHALEEEFRIFRARNVGEAEKYRRLAEQRLAANDDLLARIQRLEQETAAMLEAERTAVQKTTEDRDQLRDMVDAAKENFTDCITLHSSPGVLLTSGQMLNLEGIVGVWLNSPRFNGDIWFPFQCPLTNKTTTPVRDMTTLDFIDRVGHDLGLPAQQALFFQHKVHPLDFSTQGAWKIYSLPEQLQIFSKLVLAYQRRDSVDASFTVSVKPNHIISVQITQNREEDEIMDYSVAVTLNVVSLEGNRGIAKQHAVKFTATPEVAHRNFPYFNFVYPEPPEEIL